MAIDISGLVWLTHIGEVMFEKGAAVRRHSRILLLLLKEEDLLLHKEELLVQLLRCQGCRRIVHMHELRLVRIHMA